MSTPLDQILARIIGNSQTQQPAQPPVPASADFGANGVAANPGVLPAQDLMSSVNPAQPNPPDVRMEGLRRLLSDFTYSLGMGLTAANANPRGQGQRTQAGMGTILQMPEVLRQAQEAQKAKDFEQKKNIVQLIIEKQKADAAAANDQSLAADRAARDQNADQINARILAQNAEANRLKQEEIDNKKLTDAGTLRKSGLKRDETGNIIPVPREEMTDKEVADLDAKKNLDDLRAAQNDLATANAALARAKLDPNSPIYKDAKDKADLAEQRLALAKQSLGIRAESQNIRAGKQTNEYYQPAVTADSRLAMMMADAGPDFMGRGGSGQSDLQLLFNHIGMTLSAQKGTRVTEAEIQRAIDSRSLPQSLMARWDAIKSGKFLSPQERQDMVNNGKETRNRAWYDARRQARLAGIDEEPETDPSLPDLKMPGPANPAQGAPIPKPGSKSAGALTETLIQKNMSANPKATRQQIIDALKARGYQ